MELRQKRRRFAVLTLAFTLNGAAIAPLYLPPEKRPGTESGPTIHLLQFNTWPKNREDANVIALIDAERPDVASLQETSETLRAAVGGRLSGRYHIISGEFDLLLVRREVPSIQLRDYARHVLPGGEALAVRLDVAGQEIEVLSLHAMAPLGLARTAIRNAQFQWVARWCRSRPSPVVILGDLNATPWSSPFGRLLREGALIDSTRGFGVQPTWRTSHGPFSGPPIWPVQIPIDHCLHSAALTTISRRIGPATGSNHYPLLVTLRAPGSTPRGGSHP